MNLIQNIALAIIAAVMFLFYCVLNAIPMAIGLFILFKLFS